MNMILLSGIVLVIVILIILIFFFCPGLCLCLPCCARRQVYVKTRILYFNLVVYTHFIFTLEQSIVQVHAKQLVDADPF
jgi:hypothetical protein